MSRTCVVGDGLGVGDSSGEGELVDGDVDGVRVGDALLDPDGVLPQAVKAPANRIASATASSGAN